MATDTTFQNMLNEVVKAPNQSRSRKFLKLRKAGLTEAEANNLLDQYALFENASGKEDDNTIFIGDTKDSRTVSTPPKTPQKSKLGKKLRL